MLVKNVWRLTRVRALFLHDLTKGHRCRCNEASLLSAFGFTLGPVKNLKLDLGPVMCLMAAGGRERRRRGTKNGTHRSTISL